MTDGIAPIELPETPKRRRRRRRTRIALLIAALVVVAGAVWFATTVFGACGSLGSGVRKVDGECVGVTDGSYVFHPELVDVQRRIAEENARVRAGSSSYATVALLDPLTPTAESGLPAAQVRNRLEGAYTALHRVNTTPVAGDTRPRIQLLLANEGSTDAQGHRVVDQLVRMSKQKDHPLVAVVGLGVSTEQTQRQATELSKQGIPMIGAYLTADVLDYDHIPGLIKTSPSNRQYVDALRDYANSSNDTGIGSAIMVRDSNADSGMDLYAQTLENDFSRQMKDRIDFPAQQYAGKTGSTGADPDLFARVQANICASTGSGPGKGLQTVLYAGREVDIGAFLESLEHRTCRNAHLTILTAGLELGGILRGQNQKLVAANLTVVSAGTVDVGGWGQNAKGTPEHYHDFLSAFQKQRFDPAHLDDGGAIMMHDAVLTAAQAVRLAAPNGSTSFLTPSDVHAQLLNLNTLNSVPGASGTLSFSTGASSAGGNPKGKPIPVLQYPQPPDNPSRQVGTLYRVTGQ
ncbi:MAG: ABC transporter substrate-binding protein [Sciscionella sp.]